MIDNVCIYNYNVLNKTTEVMDKNHPLQRVFGLKIIVPTSLEQSDYFLWSSLRMATIKLAIVSIIISIS